MGSVSVQNDWISGGAYACAKRHDPLKNPQITRNSASCGKVRGLTSLCAHATIDSAAEGGLLFLYSITIKKEIATCICRYT